MQSSGGRALAVTDEQLRAAQAELARAGLWAELSSAAGLAGLRSLGPLDGPVVCVSTSSGFKDPLGPPAAPVPTLTGDWSDIRRTLRAARIDV